MMADFDAVEVEESINTALQTFLELLNQTTSLYGEYGSFRLGYRAISERDILINKRILGSSWEIAAIKSVLLWESVDITPDFVEGLPTFLRGCSDESRLESAFRYEAKFSNLKCSCSTCIWGGKWHPSLIAHKFERMILREDDQVGKTAEIFFSKTAQTGEIFRSMIAKLLVG